MKNVDKLNGPNMDPWCTPITKQDWNTDQGGDMGKTKDTEEGGREEWETCVVPWRKFYRKVVNWGARKS